MPRTYLKSSSGAVGKPGGRPGQQQKQKDNLSLRWREETRDQLSDEEPDVRDSPLLHPKIIAAIYIYSTKRVRPS